MKVIDFIKNETLFYGKTVSHSGITFLPKKVTFTKEAKVNIAQFS
jgi:hypothetical protein